MPTILIYFGFRFYFYANDHEPIHVYVEYGDQESFFELIYAKGVLVEILHREPKGKTAIVKTKRKEILKVIEKYENHIFESWNKVFVKKDEVTLKKVTQKV